jgi:Tetraspanin family
LQFGGCALLVIGITLKVHPTVLNYQNFIEIGGSETSDPLILHAAIIFIVVGAVAFVVGFFGCCGALKEQRPFLLAVR